ncbi:MAG TPA: iron export ABC transporter permease subunit FetB [Solirubrobacteraceae bacterium]|nr:iron export ABC transporter permease subunit FetB [Solirubrobacteraceae bacterium]
MSATGVGLAEVAGALALVAVAIGVSLWERARLEGEIAAAAARAFVQLTAVGFVIDFIFERDDLAYVFGLVAVMVGVGTLTARHRARSVPGALWPLLAALTLGAVSTLGLIVALGVFEPEPRFLVPVAGIVIGNAMTASAVALNRLGDEIRARSREIEATLALGATATEAARPLIRASLRTGLVPLIDQTKTTGLVAFPGIMVGSLLAGADPVDAVRLQLVILYALLGAVSLSALTAMALAYRNFFTSAHQLREAREEAGRQQLP